MDRSAPLYRAPIEMLHRNILEIDPLKTADIDCRHAIAGRISPFAERMYAACRAKPVFDDVFIESIRGENLFALGHP